MADNPRDLAGWYPFMPSATLPKEVADKILDVKLIVHLPAQRLVNDRSGGNTNAFNVRLKSIDYASAVFSVGFAGWLNLDDRDVEAAVYVGRDSAPPVSGSYVVCEDDVSFSSSDDQFELNPACVVFQQEASRLVYRGRPVFPGLEDGYNLELSVTGSGLLINGGLGLGKGRRQPAAASTACGLLTINGVRNSVELSSGNSVALSYPDTSPPRIRIEVNDEQDQ